MLGREPDHDVVPYFFSDLADWASMEYVGPGSGEPVIRGSLDDGELHRLLRRRGRQGDRGADGRAARTTSSTRGASSPSGAAPDPAALADERTDLARSSDAVELGGRDSNPDNQLQRLASCH